MSTSEISTTQTEENCKRIISYIKRDFGIDPETGKPSMSKASSFFSHSTFTPKGSPSSLRAEVDNMIYIKVSWDTGKAGLGGNHQLVQFEAPLLGTKVLRVTGGK